MAGTGFEIDDITPEKPEVQLVMSRTGASLREVLGSLVLLWRWVNQHAHVDEQVLGGGILPGMGVKDLCRVCDGDEPFWLAIEEAGWLTLSDRGVLIPGFVARFSEQAKRRVLDAKRKRLQRLEQEEQQLDRTSPPRRSRARKTTEPPAAETAAEPATERPRRKPAAPPAERDAEPRQTIGMEQGAAALRESVSARLTVDLLSNDRQLLEWWSWACRQPRPIGLDDQWHRERVLAAAARARRYSRAGAGAAITNPCAYVFDLMRAKRWTLLDAEDVQHGRTVLRALEKRDEQREDTLRRCVREPPRHESGRTQQEIRQQLLQLHRKRQA